MVMNYFDYTGESLLIEVQMHYYDEDHFVGYWGMRREKGVEKEIER